MKITIVLGAFFPVPPTMGGGVEKIWFLLAPEFVKRGHEVVMISRRTPDRPREEIIDGVKHIRVAGFDTPRSLIWLKFLDLIYSFRVKSILPAADIIVTNTFWLPILLSDVSRGKIYMHVGRYPKGQMRLYSRAARLQAPSNAIARAIAREAPQLSARIAVVPYPAPESVSGFPLPLSDRAKMMLFVGRVHPEKGVHLLVDAFVEGMRTAFIDWKLMIIGPAETALGGGGEAYLASLRAAAENAQGNVTFAGAIFDPAKLTNAFRNARLFIYPSLSERGESFGIAPLEAMTRGCAALVSNLDCFHDFIRDNETGFIFDHRAKAPADSLRERLETAVGDEALLSRVAEAGHRESADYSIGRIANRFLSDFKQVRAEQI